MELNNFWKTLPAPHFALVPTEDITDTVFRELVAWTSAPGNLHVVFTEFMSVDEFLHDKGKDKVKHRLALLLANEFDFRPQISHFGIRTFELSVIARNMEVGGTEKKARRC